MPGLPDLLAQRESLAPPERLAPQALEVQPVVSVHRGSPGLQDLSVPKGLKVLTA